MTTRNDTAAVAEALNHIAVQLNNMGLAGASTPMGAMEVMSLATKEGAQNIADALDAVARSLADIAIAIEALTGVVEKNL